MSQPKKRRHFFTFSRYFQAPVIKSLWLSKKYYRFLLLFCLALFSNKQIILPCSFTVAMAKADSSLAAPGIRQVYIR